MLSRSTASAFGQERLAPERWRIIRHASPALAFATLVSYAPLDQTSFPRHKTRHENGYLHYLPEDYSLARSLAWPFSSPKYPKMRNAPARRRRYFSDHCILGE
ncbi:hypothetical protein AJ87_19130 [Rhizobium yanglingense]|nr:hypothetical protein AJ87_19130 [Rhizobium yanglingense]